jgi:hypothetical protein
VDRAFLFCLAAGNLVKGEPVIGSTRVSENRSTTRRIHR